MLTAGTPLQHKYGVKFNSILRLFREVPKMVKPPTFDSNGMKKGAWSKEEDERLRAYIDQFGHHNWRLLPSVAGLARCGKSCRLRWVNYLKPGLRKGKFTKHEEDLVITLHHQLGNKWSTMAAKMPGRTDNEIKNYWHAHIKKRGRGGGNAGHAATTRAPKLKEEDQDQDQDQESSSSGLMINSCDDDENPKNIDALNPIADLYSFARAEDDDLSHQTGLISQLINNVDLPPLFPEGELRDFELFQEMQNDSSNSSLSFSDGFCSPSTAEFRGNFWCESFAEDMLDMVLW